MTLSIGSIDSYLDTHGEKLVDELCELSRIPAVGVVGGVDIRRMADAVVDKCQRSGMEAEIVETDGHPVVFASAGPVDSAFTLMCYGHYDAFPVDGQEGWRTEPFEPVRDGDRIWGRGVADNKAQFLAYLNAVAWWQHEGGGLPIRVKMIIEGEEEFGSRHLPQFAEKLGDRLDADLCVYSDGPMLAGDTPAILFGVRGALVMEVTSAGPTQPLHSGNFGGVVRHPVSELARLLSEMIDRNGDFLAPGSNDGVPVPTPAERTAIETLPIDHKAFAAQTGQEPRPQQFGENYYERLLYKPYFNVNGLEAGHLGAGFKSLIPESASAKVDVRLVGDQDPDEVLESFRRFARDRGYDGIEFNKMFSQPPSRTSLEHPMADIVEEALYAGFGKRAVRVPSLAGTTPDYVFTKKLGLPSMMLPFGPTDENHHAPNESMKVSLFYGGIKTAVELIGRLAAER